MINVFSDLIKDIGHDDEINAYLNLYQNKPGFALIDVQDKENVHLEDIKWIPQLDMLPIIFSVTQNNISNTNFQILQIKNNHSNFEFIKDISLTLSKQKIPIIELIDQCHSNAVNLKKQLIQHFNIKKYIFLSPSSHILNRFGSKLEFINLQEDIKSTINQYQIKDEFIHDIELIWNLIQVYKKLSFVYCHKKELLQELLTIKGSGTYIKQHQIESSKSILDPLKFKLLMKVSFKKDLQKDYFKQTFKELIYQINYEGIALVQILNYENLKIPYLDKFAVHPLSRGTGLAKSLWSNISNKYPILMWRSSIENPFNTFYFKHSDGNIKTEKWQIFWKGIDIHTASQFIDQISEKKEFWK